MSRQRYILMSFDVEEFDMPLEYGQNLTLEEQMETGFKGLEATMPVISGADVSCTFFTTANFASWYPASIQQLVHKHEVASHTFYHSHYKTEDLLQSRLTLESITGQPVYGLRMPRLKKVPMEHVIEAGYSYDSSVNPTWIPGRYNDLSLPRTVYYDKNMLRIPATVSPRMRIPLFWLAFKNMPYSFFKYLAIQSLRKDGYLCLYFHPWEFIDIWEFKLPGYAKRWSGEKLQQRLYRLIKDLQAEGDFTTMWQMVTETKSLASRQLNQSGNAANAYKKAPITK
ncbi:polysaccharide deacetylase family protein [Longitalea arenae]|uniref:polysaccharide deacetylase family protein n=1 Tax=Longitalea arenae TaxID=2812558 RepID=UPI0019677C41|nr:polysaccharide deacetylase family protein [Longitalea arenae]